MNLRTAEAYMRCFRAGKRMDSRILKAVAMAEQDDALSPLLREQLAFDQQIIDALHFIKPPEDLRQRLSGRSAGPQTSGGSLRKQASHPAILCALAGVLLIVGFLVHMELENLADFPGKEHTTRMVAMLQGMNGVELDPAKGTAGAQGDWFYLHGFEGFALPPELEPLPAVGARTFKLNGHPVAQLAIDRHTAILNVFRASDFDVRLEPAGGWRFFDQEGWAVALRQDGDLCSLLAFRGTGAEMESFVASLKP